MPADRGGREFAGTSLSVLNTEVEVVNGELAPMEDPLGDITGGGFIADAGDVFAINETIQPESSATQIPETQPVAQAVVENLAPAPNPAVADPNFQADVARPAPRGKVCQQPLPFLRLILRLRPRPRLHHNLLFRMFLGQFQL